MTAHWIDSVIQRGLLDGDRLWSWVQNDTRSALRHFQRLHSDRQSTLFETWRGDPQLIESALAVEPTLPVGAAIECTALSVDIESDGQQIWELGCARAGQASRLFPSGTGADLTHALAQLGEKIAEASLVIGHNIVDWDWPILSRSIQRSLSPLLWDTLLVQYLLEPQSTSHALGGNHRADSDALAAARLFDDQFKRLPVEIVRDLVLGRFSDSVALMRAVISLAAQASYARPSPDWIEPHLKTGGVLVVPDSLLRELAWVPGVQVVPAHASQDLGIEWLQVDVEALQAAVHGQAANSLAAQVLLAVAQRASQQDIALRFGMLPLWLLEADPALEKLVRQSCMLPRNASGIRVAPVPSDVQPLLAASPSALTWIALEDEVLVYDRRNRALGNWANLATGQPRTPLLRVDAGTGHHVWLQADEPARTLSQGGRWRSFRAELLPGVTVTPTRPLAINPVLAIRQQVVLPPDSFDQAAYWTEVIRACAMLVKSWPKDASVPVLLVVSTCSQELLELLRTGLAEIGVGVLQPEYRSRQEQLLNASRKGGMVVDLLERWPQWHAIARSAGVPLRPVLEALPLEEWLSAQLTRVGTGPTSIETSEDAATEAAEVEDAGEQADQVEQLEPEEGGIFEEEDAAEDVLRPQASATPSVARADPVGKDGVEAASRVWSPGHSELLAQALPLTLKRLHPWIGALGLDKAEHAVVLLEPRLTAFGRELSKLTTPLALSEEALPKPQFAALQNVLDSLQVRREPPPTDVVEMEHFLVNHWKDGAGHAISGFKDNQKEAIRAISVRSSDVLVALPTGGGKSVLFQVPALCRGLRTRRLTLVLSPLKALMRDQVEGLRRLGFAESVDYLNSDRPHHENAEVLQGVLEHRIVLLYVAPERFRSAVFQEVLRKRLESDGTLEYAVVDETHCVNQWGYEFRPDYFYALQQVLRNFRVDEQGDIAPLLMLSATVTASDKKALKSLLQSGAKPTEERGLPLVVLPEKFEHPLRAQIEVEPRAMKGSINSRDGFEQALAERLEVIVECIRHAQENKERTGQRSAVIVFVSRRKHAEDLAQLVAQRTPCAVDYFHAGVDSITRENVYQDFMSGKLDVLVATKAFGMGMDIPDIHWAIHLSPPAYLEDYLQEVGRIGRSDNLREKAKLDSLKAILLYSTADFENIRTLRARNSVNRTNTQELYTEICGKAEEFDKQWVAVLPQEGFELEADPALRRIKATRIRMQLYWLEQAGKLSLQGMVPSLLPISLNIPRLKTIPIESGPHGLVATQLLLMVSSPPTATGDVLSPVNSPSAVGSGVGGFLSRLAGWVGMLFGNTAPPPTQGSTGSLASLVNQRKASGGDSAVVNVGQIMLRCKLPTLGDVLTCLAELETRGAVELKRSFEFSIRKLGEEPSSLIEHLFTLVDRANSQLLTRLSAEGRHQFTMVDLIQDGAGVQINPGKRKLYEDAFRRGALFLARASGIRIRQQVRKTQDIYFEARLPRAQEKVVRERQKEILEITKSIFYLLRGLNNKGEKSVSMKDLIKFSREASQGKKFSEVRLKKALGVLSSLNLASLSVTMLPISYVLSLEGLNQSLDGHQDLWERVLEINRLAELRNDAMEIFAYLPKEVQDQFIEGYFSKSTAQDLEEFLDSQLRDIDPGDDAEVSANINAKREHLRATEIGKFFEFFKKSEEQNQWLAISHPYSSHLLVNAGPGAGKTSVLVGRIVHLIREQGIQPQDIVVLAFNRAVVFEIRRRVKEIFRTIGYAAYVQRLRIHTFHSFALKELASTDGADGVRRENVIGDFTQRLRNDQRFREKVARGVRSILMDEFQDVTDEIYEIIRQLHLGSYLQAGVMVIGDDDQDILRWQRENGVSSEKYFKGFFNDFDKVEQLVLKVNFRSGADIVQRSQAFISEIISRNRYSRRLKNEVLVPCKDASDLNQVERVVVRGQNWNSVLGDVKDRCSDLLQGGYESIAVLCRSNSEVTQVYRHLAQLKKSITVQGGGSYRVAFLRHVALWLDFLESKSSDSNRALNDESKAELVDEFWKSVDTADVVGDVEGQACIREMWDFCCAERRFPHVSDLIRFIRELQTDDIVRLRGSREIGARLVISTIHKVKGLEFDAVLVLPSNISFSNSRSPDGAILFMDAAEEARLYYVAMTRAKRYLAYFLGDREFSWAKRLPVAFEGISLNAGFIQGDLEEVSLGWAYEKIPGFNDDPDNCQDYIEKCVKVGDKVFLGGKGAGAGKGIFHTDGSRQRRQIGFLSSNVKNIPLGLPLEVKAIVRIKYDSADPRNLGKVIAGVVLQRGWGYAVLVGVAV